MSEIPRLVTKFKRNEINARENDGREFLKQNFCVEFNFSTGSFSMKIFFLDKKDV